MSSSLRSSLNDRADVWPASDAELAPATQRAYASDLRDIERWCLEYEISGGIRGLDERRFFAYLVDLARHGRSSATIRRRLTAFRALLAADAAPESELASRRLTELDLFRLEKRVLAGRNSRTGVLVVSDDAIIRAGLRVVLTESGILCWSDEVSDVDDATVAAWDYVLVWIAASSGIDPFGAIERVRQLGAGVTDMTPIVAVFPGTLSDVVRLRLSEAGIRYALPHGWLSNNLDSLSARLSNAEVPLRYHLETPFALRQQLSLSLNGDLAALLDAAKSTPPEVWTEHTPQQRLPISRADIQHLRQIALNEAGIPAPSFSKYATSMRTPPSTPEWRTVREIVRAAFALSAPPA